MAPGGDQLKWLLYQSFLRYDRMLCLYSYNHIWTFSPSYELPVMHITQFCWLGSKKAHSPIVPYQQQKDTWKLIIKSSYMIHQQKSSQSYTFSIPLTKKYPPASNRHSLSLRLCNKHKFDFTITGRRPINIQWVSFMKSLFWTKPSFPVLDLSLFSKE